MVGSDGDHIRIYQCLYPTITKFTLLRLHCNNDGYIPADYKCAGILVGGFVAVLGAIITLACLEVLENVGRVLSDLWHGLVDAFRR